MNNSANAHQAAISQVQTVATQIKDEAAIEFDKLRGHLETCANGLKKEMADKVFGPAAPKDCVVHNGKGIDKK